MNAITGWVSYNSDILSQQSTFVSMIQTLTNRGPDGSGMWIGRHVALGHRQLTAVEGLGSPQPVTFNTPNGNVTIVYTGTVYNSDQLTEQLIRRGHRFSAQIDPEVVLRGYLEWGDDIARRMRGVYSLAIWDGRDSKLVMIRDRRGNKPLYYYTTPDGVLFGSEPKAILANPMAPRIVDQTGLRGFFALTHSPGWALWKGMSEVVPGTIVTVNERGTRTRTYWKLAPAPHADNKEETISRVHDLLSDVIYRQTIADAPYGLMLSGGLDSSGIAGLVAQILTQRQRPLYTFSVDYFGQGGNFVPDEFRRQQDSPFVQDMVRHINSVHRELVLKPELHADPEVRYDRIRAKDIPEGVGDMDASLYILCKLIKKESSVAFSGDSADGLFGEFEWFDTLPDRNEHTFPWLRQNKALVVEMTRLVRPDVRDLLELDEYTADEYATALKEVEHLDQESALERRIRDVTHMYLTRSVRSLLDRTERLSAAVGLDVRSPYSDHALVEYVYNVPPSLKIFDGREKSVLRHAVRHVLPQSVVDRVKSGYPSSRNPDYIQLLQQQAKDLVADKTKPVFSLVDRSWLARVVDAQESQMSTGVRWALDRVLDLNTWFEIYQPQIQLDE